MSATEAVPQQVSTFILVPGDANPEAPAPGSYFRLGNYSYVEESAPPETLYPRQYLAEGGTAADAAGPSTFGIALACSGRLLIQALEKSYIYSQAAMHIDTADTFTLNSDLEMVVTAGQSISITSGNAQSITISADDGQGDVSLIAMQNTKTINGEDYEWITKDTYKFYECDVYTYRIGNQYTVAMSATFTVLLGADFKVVMSASFSFAISFAFELTLSLELKINVAISIKAGLIGIGFGVWDFKCVLRSASVREGKIDWGSWCWETKAVDTKWKAVDAKTYATQSKNIAIGSQRRGVQANADGVNNNTNGLTNHV